MSVLVPFVGLLSGPSYDKEGIGFFFNSMQKKHKIERLFSE